MGRKKTRWKKNSSGRSPLTDERNALLSCNMIGRDRSTQKVGVETEWVDPEINDPEQGDLEIKIMSRSRRKLKGKTNFEKFNEPTCTLP
ncbi:hypothetical protein TNCV_3051181 [Trichonephila clavipes]|nr:hypothetical protein TNCV_3051181 [Trichonephila clavipes]